MMTVLQASQLKKRYQLGVHEVFAVNGIDFEITAGEFVAIMGPSGSGKSTLLHLLGGLDVPTSGTVTLAGQLLSSMDDQHATLARRRNIGFVFQFFNLLPTLSAEENILLPVMIDDKKPIDYKDRLDQLIALVGLEERRAHKPDQLSGGEQQRVALARALITQPSILLADEPTGNLDSNTGKTIMELLRRSCDSLDQAIVVVTHDARAAAYADRVIFLRDGQVERQIEFLLEDPLVQRMRTIIEIMESLDL